MSQALSLIEELELASVPDLYSPKGRRRPLIAILSLTVVATLAGRMGREPESYRSEPLKPGLDSRARNLA